MKKLTKLLLFAGLILAGHSIVYGQQAKIALQHSGSMTTFTDITLALAASVNGDTLYLPGGPIYASGTILIDKSLTIIGVGHYPDSTTATYQTVFSQPIFIVPGADGGLLSGVKCPQIFFGNGLSNQNVNNYRIVRCYIENLYPSSWGNILSENILISENIINYLPAQQFHSV